MRTTEGTTIWYLRVIHHLAQNGEVWTYDISGEEWGEVDFPADLEGAEALCAAWDEAGALREAAAGVLCWVVTLGARCAPSWPPGRGWTR